MGPSCCCAPHVQGDCTGPLPDIPPACPGVGSSKGAPAHLLTHLLHGLSFLEQRFRQQGHGSPGGPLQARRGLGTTQGCGEPAAHCDPLGAQPTEGKSWALAQGHAALGGGPGDPPGTTRGQGSGSAARRWGCAPVRGRPRTRHGESKHEDPSGSPPTHWRGPALRREVPPWHRTHRGPRDPRGSGAASSGRHEPRGAGPHSEEQCGLTPTCWPRAAAQGASAGTVTGCHAGGRDWPPGHGRRGCPGRQPG